MTIYADYSRDKQGPFLGLHAWQLVAIVVTVFPILGALNAHRWGLLAGLLAGWALLVVVVVVPIHGRPAVGWLAAFALFTMGRVTGWSAWRSKLARGVPEESTAPDLPGSLGGIEIHESEPQPPTMRRFAIIEDRARRSWSVTAMITHPGISTAGVDERASMGRGLADLLDICSRGELVSEITFMVRTVPDDGAERAHWVDARRTGANPAAAQINDELAAALQGASFRTEAFVSVTVPEARIARQARTAGGGVAGRAWVLGQVTEEIGAHLTGAMGATGVTWLTSPELAVAVRTGFAPTDRAAIVDAITERGDNPDVNDSVPWAQAGPSGADSLARCYTHDAWASTSMGIGLPARGALMGALAPILRPTQPGERRSFMVTYPIITQRAADRQTASGEWKADIGETLREKSGTRARAKERDAVAHTRNLDEKLAAGQSLTTPYAVCAVTVPRTWKVGDATHRLQAAIRRAGFAPQILDLAQDTAFAAACLPLGVSLKRTGR